MKRVLPLLLVLILACSAAFADPLPLVEDLADVVVIPYDEGNPDAGKYTFSYRYPRVDESDPDAYLVNSFYDYEVSNAVGFEVPMNADYFASVGENAVKDISYQLTCNNDVYFSILLRTEEVMGDLVIRSYAGHVFSRAEGSPGSTLTLPQLLNILSTRESDTWLQDRQTAKADTLVRQMVWDQIQENSTGIPYYSDFDEEAFSGCFFPEEDFYLDETGNPVFFLQPGSAAPEDAGLLIFPISLEELFDEM